jgi:membrane associated rhomboid family serine protease
MRLNYKDTSAVWILIGVNFFVFILTLFSQEFRQFLTLYSEPFLGNQYWKIITAMFVHAGFFHILFNMLTLLFFGMFCIQLIETKWFLIVYFVGGIVGNILFLLLAPPYYSVVGASGAIYALGGVLAVMRPNLKVYLYFVIPLPLWVVIIFGFLITALDVSVAWQAHLGGLIVGLIAGYFFRRKERSRLRTGYYEW